MRNAQSVHIHQWPELQVGLTEPAQALESSTQILPSKRRFRIAGLFRVWLISLFLLAGLVLTVTAEALTLSQGYQTLQSDLTPGMVVALSQDSNGQSRYVEKVNKDNATRLAGVVVSRDDSLLAIATASSTVYVANFGQLPTLVSDINGTPKKGDLLTISPLAGVLMLASNPNVGTFGVMVEDFASGAPRSVNITDSDGRQVKAQVAKPSLNIDIRQAAGQRSGGWLGSIGYSLTGRDISSWRVLTALIIFATLLAVEGVLVHGVVTGSIRALGRNPLAKESIYRESFRGAVAAVVILVVSLSVISLVVWV